MTRLERARALQTGDITHLPEVKWAWEHRETYNARAIAASLALDGLPARTPKGRKLPWVRNVYPGSGLPF